MSQLDNTSAMLSQLCTSFQQPPQASTAGDKPAQHASRRTCVRLDTHSRDLSILAHAQDQLQSHLSTAPMRSRGSVWRVGSQRTRSQSLSPTAHRYPGEHVYASGCGGAGQWQQPQRRSSTQFETNTRPDLRTPFRWRENSVLLSTSVSASDSEGSDGHVRPSIEPCNPVSPEPLIPDQSTTPPQATSDLDAEKHHARSSPADSSCPWDPAPKRNAYVAREESWVLRAGLKREREAHSHRGTAKRRRARG
jgi:hypothetical protein